MKILSTKEWQEVVEWTPKGDGFVIKDKTAFLSEVLPKYLKTNKEYRSFKRRLGRWGFQFDELSGIYYHKHFQRDKPHLCGHILTGTKAAKQDARLRHQRQMEQLARSIRSEDQSGSNGAPSIVRAPAIDERSSQISAQMFNSLQYQGTVPMGEHFLANATRQIDQNMSAFGNASQAHSVLAGLDAQAVARLIRESSIPNLQANSKPLMSLLPPTISLRSAPFFRIMGENSNQNQLARDIRFESRFLNSIAGDLAISQVLDSTLTASLADPSRIARVQNFQRALIMQLAASGRRVPSIPQVSDVNVTVELLTREYASSALRRAMFSRSNTQSREEAGENMEDSPRFPSAG